MTAPTKLILREWKKPEVAYELHGWKPNEGLACVLDDNGQPQVMQFVLPAQFDDHNRPTPAFAQAPPIEIAEIRLVPPPCRADHAQAHSLRVQAREIITAIGNPFGFRDGSPGWELVRLQYDNEILTLTPEDDGPLKELLERFKEDKRHEYAARKQELHELLELVRHRHPTSGRAHYYAHVVSDVCVPYVPGVAEAKLYFLDQDRLRLEFDFTHGFLTWTIVDASRHPDIRNPYLQSKWAKENGLDLQQMADERKQVAAWAGLVNEADPVAELFKKSLGDDFECFGFPTAPSPAALDLARAADLKFGASIRFRVMFANQYRAWLTDCSRHPPQSASERAGFGAAQEKVVTLETIQAEQGQVLTKLDSVEKKTDQVLSGVQTLTEMAGEQAAARDQWVENPLGRREAVADYLLAMDAVKIKRAHAIAIVRFGYGDTRKQCADQAGVSEATIKRALQKVRETLYARFFARTREQKLEARRMMKKPDEAYARLRALAAKDPDELRAMIEQLIAKAQDDTERGSQWDQAVERLS